jgi:hypothetical protein
VIEKLINGDPVFYVPNTSEDLYFAQTLVTKKKF